ncbi:LysR family transcriptional regulator [Burkholderia diffusa]|uniref:LysR family transcriptional regulator n=1 Tax=Burkholderia diffusa TaxID=488732 RepID=UPI002AB2A227|nr:LysR family transcriptional regulator [Burkholderia diffusa]
MMNLLEETRIFGAVIEHGGVSGAASSLMLGNAQVNARLDCLERYPGCRLLPDRMGDETPASRSMSATARIDACATVHPRETIRRGDGVSTAASKPLHGPSF